MKQIFYIIILLFFSLNISFAKDKKKILILHSYNQSFKWTNDLNKGIISILKNDNYEFFTEYMDTKRFNSKNHYENLFRLYFNKYEKIKFDVIISSDNNALDFLKKNSFVLFKGAPVIFSGVNNLKEEEIDSYINFKGISEEVSLKKNLELINKLHPKRKKIYILNDLTTTGKALKKEFLLEVKTLKKEISYEFIEGLNLKDLKVKLKKLPPSSILFQLVYFRSKDGVFYSYDKISNFIAKESPLPLYSLYDFSLGNGIVGGFLTSGFFQGKTAALMAEDILRGKNIKNLKTIFNSPNSYMFDYKQLKNKNIDINLLPKNSFIINKEKDILVDYRIELILIFIMFLCLLIFAFYLIYKNKKIKKAEKSLEKEVYQRTIKIKEQKDIFENLFNKAKDGNALLKDGKFIKCNESLLKIFEYKNEKDFLDLEPSFHSPKFQEDEKLSFLKAEEMILICLNEGFNQFEWIHKKSTNVNFWAEVVLTKIKIDNEILIHVICRDISDKKLLEKQILRRNEDLEESNYELEVSLDNLKKTQNQLISSEKLASLGALVAGVAHEVNTPIGIGLTGSSHLSEINKELKNKYDNEIMSEEDFEEYLKTSEDLAFLINTNLKKAASLIKSFKQVAVDQSSEEKRNFDLKIYLNEILESIHSVLKKTKIDVNIFSQEDIKILSYPGAFSQVITNLIMNSIIHGFEKNQEGKIDITVTKKDEKIIIIYKDNGKGIKKENLKKIYDPFFTTNRENGGSGLGLNIIFNIITSKLKGSITCKSEENRGVEFIIIFNM